MKEIKSFSIINTSKEIPNMNYINKHILHILGSGSYLYNIVNEVLFEYDLPTNGFILTPLEELE